jgi:signal transduction histidine kinase
VTPTFGRGRPLVAALVAGSMTAITLILWLQYRTTQEWQHSTALLVERRAAERADTLVRALTHDMRGVQESVLAGRHWDEVSADPPEGLTDLVAVSFARYPYPESFFAWRLGAPRQLFFTRADRPPAWLPASQPADLYPVRSVEDPPIAAALLHRIDRDVANRRDYSLFETTLDGAQYQIVARILYRDPAHERAESVIGFMVDLGWARREYFKALSRQMTGIGDGGPGLDIAMLDEKGQAVVDDAPGASVAGQTRTFPLFFFHPDLVILGQPPDLLARTWTVRVSGARDPTLLTASTAAEWTLLMIVLASAMLVGSVVLAMRVIRADAALTQMRSDFVAAVTHELKTPLATIRAVGETLAIGRIASGSMLKEYSQVLVHEAKRLTRLVDNLLAYARVTDTDDVYAFEPAGPGELLDEALQGFHQQLTDGAFDLHLDIPADLPTVRADRTAMRLLLDNVIDNAIRYSNGRHWLGISARVAAGRVQIEVKDKGRGIPPEEISLVQRKFYRGRMTRTTGNGLGLAIATRIATDHGATLTLQSILGEGTTVCLTLPVAGW